MERSEWLRTSPEELSKNAPFPFRIVPTAEALYEDFATALYDEIAAAATGIWSLLCHSVRKTTIHA